MMLRPVEVRFPCWKLVKVVKLPLKVCKRGRGWRERERERDCI